MSGGGRQPPSTRRNSPAMDSRRSVTPPARRNINGNAGYAAIVHDSHGRFTRKIAAVHVDSDELNNSRTGAVVTLETGSVPIMHASSLDNSMEESVCMEGYGPLGFHGSLDEKSDHEIPSRSKDMLSAAAMPNREAVLLDTDVKNMDCSSEVSASQPLVMANMVDNSSSPIRNVSVEMPHLGDDCNGTAGNDKNSTVSDMQGVCANASVGVSLDPANINVWKKHGVVPLPSLKDLGADSIQDGVAHLDKVEVQGFLDRFQVALVGRLFGRRLPFYLLNAELKRRWECFGHFKLLTVSSDCFICLFETVVARDNVLMGGPWIIAGQVLGLDIWSSGFSPSTMHGFVTPIWVRFPGLPLYCWGSNSLTHIASLLGKPIWSDQATAMMERGAYARVCVQIDLSKPLVATVPVLGLNGLFKQRVEYEGLTNFCFKCGRVGHKDVNCPDIIQVHDKANIKSTTPTTLDGAVVSLHKEVIFNSGSAPPCMGSKQITNTVPSIASSQTFVPHNGSVSAVHNSKPHGCVDDVDGLGPWMLVQRRRKQHNPPRRSPRSGLHPARIVPMATTVQNLHNEKVQNFSSPHIQVSACDPSLQEHCVLGNDGSLVQPMSQVNEPVVFSSSPKNFDNDAVSTLARVNSNRAMKHKNKSPLVKAKQILYDAGPLLVESHKKRRPSIQSIGEGASSSAPG